MSQINVSDLSFCYEGSYDMIFDHVSFQLDTDWKLGFVGRNGRGKTTFLNLLQGKFEYRGSITASVRFDNFPFPVSERKRDTVEVLESLDPALESWKLYRELSLLAVDEQVLYRPFETLSNGEQTKVLLAALFLREGGFLLIDEPTNHLDLEGRQIVSQYLARKKGFILVSHDRAFLDGCVDHILSLNKLDIEVQQGNFSTWFENKERRDQQERTENQRLKRDVARLTEAARRTSEWSEHIEAGKIGTHAFDRGRIGHKAAKMMKRSKTIEARQLEAAGEKSKLLKNIELTQDLKLHPLSHPKARLVEIVDLAPDYGLGPLCTPVSFTVGRGERVALTGRNGAGKSTLLKLLMGQEVPHSGRLSLASGLILSTVPQDTSFLAGDLSGFAEASGIDESLFKAILRKLDFSRIQFEKDMADYSAGQKKKVLIARSLCQQAHLYLWDEPLNYIDLFSRMQIEALLMAFRPAMLLVEHDRGFLSTVADKIVELSRPEALR